MLVAHYISSNNQNSTLPHISKEGYFFIIFLLREKYSAVVLFKPGRELIVLTLLCIGYAV